MKLLHNIVLLVIFSSHQSFGRNVQNWHLEKQTKQLSIFSAKKIDSDFLQIKAEINFVSPSEKVLAQFGEGNECWQWQGRCASSKIVKQLNKNEKIVYTTINMPWPLTDRDFLFYSLFNFDVETQTTTLTLSPATNKQAENLVLQTDLVRAKSNIVYTVHPIPKTSTTAYSTKLTILMHTDLGGDISPSFVNQKLVDELHEDIIILIKLVERSVK